MFDLVRSIAAFQDRTTRAIPNHPNRGYPHSGIPWFVPWVYAGMVGWYRLAFRVFVDLNVRVSSS